MKCLAQRADVLPDTGSTSCQYRPEALKAVLREFKEKAATQKWAPKKEIAHPEAPTSLESPEDPPSLDSRIGPPVPF